MIFTIFYFIFLNCELNLRVIVLCFGLYYTTCVEFDYCLEIVKKVCQFNKKFRKHFIVLKLSQTMNVKGDEKHGKNQEN